MIELETKRLLLVPLNLSFCTETYVSWLNDPEVYRFLETRGNQTLKTLAEFINKQIELKNNIWAIVIRGSNKHIGNIKIDNINLNHGFGEYGIMMGDKDEWRKSYAREASERVIDYFFKEEYFLRKLNLGVVKDNVSAIHLYKKMGFVQEGHYKKHLKYDDKFYDLIRMSKFNSLYNYE